MINYLHVSKNSRTFVPLFKTEGCLQADNTGYIYPLNVLEKAKRRCSR